MSSKSQSVYNIFYTKDLYKKKKVYKEGFLFLSEHTGKIFDQDGVMVTSFKNKYAVDLQEEYTINNYLITIDKTADLQSFKSGAIFIRKSILPLQVKYKKILPLNGKKSKSDELIDLQCGLQMENKIYNLLRPHQRQGVEFMFKCLWGAKETLLTGCILADFMGLGKTLQTLALCYSVLKQKLIKKFVIVCPLTLLDIWEKQSKKWLQQKVTPLVCYGDGAETVEIVKKFVGYEYRMLIISYETFYRNIEKISGKCDLIIFDEGHRMKNKKSKLLLKLKVFKCEKRILLTGTPIQNNLEQLYTCVSVINPRLFGNETIFRNVFQKPILQGLNKKATLQQKQLAKERTCELAKQIRQFSLRRTADVLKKYLPPKNEHLIFIKLTDLQNRWYTRIVNSKKQKEEDMFQTLNSLRKLFVHPKILKLNKIDRGQTQICAEDCNQELSYKVEITLKIVESAVKLQEKTIIVSYYTETLDFIGVILKERGIRYAKLDGRQKTSERKNAVISFEKQSSVLLLSGKAGGTGLTLICATRMIMIEPDWNPSNDSQVMGRIWRQGQEKEVHIYRLIIASTFEQKMLERQKLKKTLANNLIDNKEQQAGVDFENMSKFFIQNRSEVLLYTKIENELNQFLGKQKQIFGEIQGSDHGIIFVRSICSCNQQSKTEKQQDCNQFTNMGVQNFLVDPEAEKQPEIEEDEECQSIEITENKKDKLEPEKKKKQIGLSLPSCQINQQDSQDTQSKKVTQNYKQITKSELARKDFQKVEEQITDGERDFEESTIVVSNVYGKSQLKDIGANKLLKKIKKK